VTVDNCTVGLDERLRFYSWGTATSPWQGQASTETSQWADHPTSESDTAQSFVCVYVCLCCRLKEDDDDDNDDGEATPAAGEAVTVKCSLSNVSSLGL